MEELLVRYGIFFGKRNTLKQKQKFLIAITKEFEKIGYQTKFANDEKKGNSRTVDYFIGDIGKADTIICANFDTPNKVLWPNYHYYPLNGEKTFKSYWLATLLPSFLSMIVALVLMYIIISNETLGGDFRPVLIFVSILVAFLLSTVISKGLINKYNINRNTASIMAILETAKRVKDNKKVAFILIDKGCSDNKGAQLIKRALPTTMDKKLFIYLDCIGNGETFTIAHKENLTKESEKLKKAFTGTQDIRIKEVDNGNLIYTPSFYFNRAIIITNGHINNDGNSYVKNVNTSKDTFADIPTVTAVVEMLVKFAGTK